MACLSKELGALDHIHSGSDEALLHADVEKTVEQVMHSFENHHHVLLQRFWCLPFGSEPRRVEERTRVA